MRVFAGSLGTETNTFSPLPTGLDSYYESCYFPAGKYPDTPQFLAGPLWAARRQAPARGWTLIEGLVAFAGPAGPTTRLAYETLRAELLADLEAALPVDIVLLGMHGAMVADGYDDCEGDLLARVRAMVGPDVVIGVEDDPHTHLSQAMVENATLILAFKEYPHTDVFERGDELVTLCARVAAGEIRPVPAVFDCQMISMMHTSREPMRGFVDRIKALEGHDGIVSISPIHGFPWGDTPDMGTKVLVYADGDGERAARMAERLGREIIAFRDRLAPGAMGIDEALDAALAEPKGPVVLADTADNSGGGAPNDSTFVLRRLLERGIDRVALGPLWDPVAVSICFNAGEGARLALRIGGKIGPVSGDPLDADVQVLRLCRSLVMTGLGGGPTALGDSALVQVAGVQVLLTAQRQQAMGSDMFTRMGCDLGACRLIVVKSSQHFFASYSKIATRVIYVDGPGTLTSNLGSLPFRKVPRPKWGIGGDST
ncbi:MAG TPA: M81 family metallopeptidase [Burkholderiaceae bacterium]|nr:M81 family metallopeptidase [Burkholderiaceae bacterium]